MNYNGFFTVKGNVIYCNIPLERLAKLAISGNKKAELAKEKIISLIKKGFQFSSYFEEVNNSCYFEKSHINAPRRKKKTLSKEQENEKKRRTKCLTIRRKSSILA